MTVNKGLLSLVENTPNFSNQALENAVDTLKVGWVIKSSHLDTDIQNNTVLTTSQKNDLKDDINNIGHINLGRVLGDLVRHSNSIIDATIVPVPADETQTEDFLGILQNVQTVQGLIPELYGVPASDKARAGERSLGHTQQHIRHDGRQFSTCVHIIVRIYKLHSDGKPSNRDSIRNSI